MKQCPCKEHEGERSLPFTAFFNHKSRPDGLSHSCKACHKRQVQRARSSNIETARAGGRASYYRHKDQRLTRMKQIYAQTRETYEVIQYRMLHSAKGRAKRYNLDFTITLEDILIPDVCPVLSIPLKRSEHKSNDNSPTLDRIDSTKGYIKGNVLVISKRANTIKNCGTPDEHRRIYEYFAAYA